MDDRRAQFLLMCEDICHAALLADIPVDLTTRDGRRLRGIPSLLTLGTPKTAGRPAELLVDLGEDQIALEAVLTVCVAAPIDAAR
jgi:hypothetical protein